MFRAQQSKDLTNRLSNFVESLRDTAEDNHQPKIVAVKQPTNDRAGTDNLIQPQSDFFTRRRNLRRRRSTGAAATIRAAWY